MVGKKIPDDQWVYLQQMNLRPDFEKVEPLITIHGRTNAELSDIDALRKRANDQDKVIDDHEKVFKIIASYLKNDKEFMRVIAQTIKEGTLSAEMLMKNLGIKVDETD
jgi:hypothetical protein